MRRLQRNPESVGNRVPEHAGLRLSTYLRNNRRQLPHRLRSSQNSTLLPLATTVQPSHNQSDNQGAALGPPLSGSFNHGAGPLLTTHGAMPTPIYSPEWSPPFPAQNESELLGDHFGLSFSSQASNFGHAPVHHHQTATMNYMAPPAPDHPLDMLNPPFSPSFPQQSHDFSYSPSPPGPPVPSPIPNSPGVLGMMLPNGPQSQGYSSLMSPPRPPVPLLAPSMALMMSLPGCAQVPVTLIISKTIDHSYVTGSTLAALGCKASTFAPSNFTYNSPAGPIVPTRYLKHVTIESKSAVFPIANTTIEQLLVLEVDGSGPQFWMGRLLYNKITTSLDYPKTSFLSH